MFVIKYKKIFFTISLLAVLASVSAIFFFGLNFGIDFTGGSILEVSYKPERPAVTDLRLALDQSDFSASTIQPAGDSSVIFRLSSLTDAEKTKMLDVVSLNTYEIQEERFSSIGPTLSSELATKGVMAVVLVSLLIVLFIAFVFRGVSKPINSWVYGLIAIVALLHDILIPVGIFTVLGYLYGIEIDALFLTALMTILGLSVNDTIVVFDRIRENLKRKISEDFETVVGVSLNQTFMRSINTSLTVLIVLLALYFLGGTTTKEFSLVLIIGTIVGTYSSIFLASPLLVWWNNVSHKNS